MADSLPSEPWRGPLSQARALLAGARRVVVLSGAGISTDSGIPDFRGPNGVWTKDPEAEKASTLAHYVRSAEVRQRAWQRRLSSTMWDAQPNRAHTALVDLERSGRLDTLVTQNIDGLHQKAGSDPASVVEIHGTSLAVMCLRCGHRQPAEPVHRRVRQGDLDPACRQLVGGQPCGGILKPATISFGQDLVATDLSRAEDAAAACDLLLAVGSTLGVYPVAGMVPIAARAGAAIVIMNGGPTALDALADVMVEGLLGTTLPALVAGLAPI
jgi:NAD-dependent deacetylase